MDIPVYVYFGCIFALVHICMVDVVVVRVRQNEAVYSEFLWLRSIELSYWIPTVSASCSPIKGKIVANVHNI